MEEQSKATRRVQVLARLLTRSQSQQVIAFNATAAKVEQISPPSVFLESAPTGLQYEYSTLLTKEAVMFVAKLVDTFDVPVEQLHWKRLERKCRLRDPSQLPTISSVGEGEGEGEGAWKVAPLPHRLRNRHLDLGDVSPADGEHFKRALQADVQGIQVDFDDGHCPTWQNQIVGLHNIYRAVHNQIPGVPHISQAPVLMMRPRAWNMTEHNMMVNGKAVPGPLFDFGLLMFHTARQLDTHQSGPYFYLSKVEGANEAKLWNDIFVWSERELGMLHGTIKACVLIENIFSSFELDEILFVLKDHSLGLNCGIWDYAASIICKFGDNRNFVLPDRNKYVSMDRHFLKSYMQLVIRTCHRRGAHATGGMAALLVPRNNEADLVIEKVCKGKLAEIKEGVDGFMVYDIQLVPHINKLWRESAPGENQLSIGRADVRVTGRDLLEMPLGGVTFAGLKHNIGVVILFIFHWFEGRGHYYYKGAVEDSATAEISRSQIWQWIRHQAQIEDFNSTVTKTLANRLAEEFVNDFILKLNSEEKRNKLRLAKQIFLEIVCKREFPDFITTFLNDNHVFWSFHKER